MFVLFSCWVALSYAVTPIPTVTVSYEKNCWICAVDDWKVPVTTTLPDGSDYTYFERHVKCTWGFNFCPKNPLDIPSFHQDQDWVGTISMEYFNHAVSEIKNGVNSGTYGGTVYQTALKQSFRFVVTWKSIFDDSGTPYESIVVTMQKI